LLHFRVYVEAKQVSQSAYKSTLVSNKPAPPPSLIIV
jgi:hypothetical protein